MEKFTASNGLTNLDVILDEYTSEVVDALREFFQYERDQELGRWRWPKNPDVVVYASNVDENRVRALSELTGQSEWSQRGSESNDWYDRAARAYFAAHPEPKPWMEVTEGVYAVTPQAHTYERLLLFRNGEWLHLYKSPNEGECDPHTAEWVAKIAYMEGRLTRMVPEVDRAVPGF